MAKEPIKVLAISDLLKLSQPLTATISLHSNYNPELNTFNPNFSVPLNPNSNSPNTIYCSSDSQILQPLNQPSILIGTLKLPSLHHSPCPNNSTCLLFSDGSAPPICCDILNFCISLINRKIKVLSWNFIPFGAKKGAFLEIIKWVFFEPLVTYHSEFSPLGSESVVGFDGDPLLKSSCRVCGLLESISPVSAVPCTSVSNGSSNSLRGFLANINVCECKLCKLKKDEVGLNQEESNHRYTKSVVVYFVASASYWHPVISKLIGSLVVLLGLRKKVVYIGKEEHQLMYVTAERSFLKVLKVANREVLCKRNDIEGKGECGVYIGFVKGVYLQGMLVELDREVWFLLPDKLMAVPHSVRVGALICARNVHFVNPNYSWTKMLILGSCVKTSISTVQFSPLRTCCHVFFRSQSMLEKFIEVLPFSVRLWALLTVSSFRKKFSRTLSEKDILGSKNFAFLLKADFLVVRCYQSKGLAQTYTSSHLSMPILLSRQGVVMEFCKHESSAYPSEMNHDDLKLVLPISHFIHHSEAIWLKVNVLNEDTSISNFLSSEAKSKANFSRRIISSNDIVIVLVGSLQFSPSSGRLQLVDATGAVDVVIPDLPSAWSENSIYKVYNYSLVMEGVFEQRHASKLLKKESLSCRNIFHSCPVVQNADLAVYVYFHLRDATCENRLIYPHKIQEDSLQEVASGRFHLVRITHKFPVNKFHDVSVISRQQSLYAEAMVLPWDLFLGESGTNYHAAKDFKDGQEESIKNIKIPTYLRQGFCKRYKINNAFSSDCPAVKSVLRGANNGSSGPLNDGSGAVTDGNKQDGKECFEGSQQRIICSVTRYVDSHKLVTSGLLCSTKTNEKFTHGCKQNTGKVLLEFEIDSYCKYQSLQIGSWYLVKHQKEEVFCKQIDSRQVNCAKVLVSSVTQLWSLSFLSDESSTGISSMFPLHKGSTCNLEAQSEDCHLIKLSVLRSMGKSPGIFTDFEIYLSANCLGTLASDLMESEENPTTASNGAEVVSVAMQESACQLPHGRLVTVHGRILTVDNPNHEPISYHVNLHEIHRLRRVLGNVRVSVLMDHQIVKIAAPNGNHMFPVGFGPGVDATFHRVLSSGQNTFTLTSVSFIAISSLREVISKHWNEYPDPSAASASHNDSSLKHQNEYPDPSTASALNNDSSVNYSSSSLLSNLICLDPKPVWVRCRVLSVHFLVLEKYNDPGSNTSSSRSVSIPLAGFILDDGSSSCCCWANADNAAKLLRLHEEISIQTVKENGWIGTNNIPKAAGYHIAKIVEKHGRIIVKNFGSSYDSSTQDLNFSGSSVNFFSRLEENVLNFIIINACFGSSWNVLVNVMKPEAVDQLGRRHTEMEATIVSMQNLWIQEVNLSNPLMEARNLAQELLCG